MLSCGSQETSHGGAQREAEPSQGPPPVEIGPQQVQGTAIVVPSPLAETLKIPADVEK